LAEGRGVRGDLVQQGLGRGRHGDLAEVVAGRGVVRDREVLASDVDADVGVGEERSAGGAEVDGDAEGLARKYIPAGEAEAEWGHRTVEEDVLHDGLRRTVVEETGVHSERDRVALD